MRILREWLERFWGALGRSRQDQDLEEELRFHQELTAEEARRRDQTPQDAARAPRIRLGGVSQAMDALRDQRGLPWLADLPRDVRYAFRTLQRSPSFATVAVLTLALGIGATTTIYSVADTILLRPLPFADSDRLVRVVENVAPPNGVGPLERRGVTCQEFLEWRARTRTLEDAFAVRVAETVVRTKDGAARLWGGSVSPNTFTMLGTRPLLGTLAFSGDTNPNVVVLSFETWRRLFHSAPDVVGATLEFRADFNASYTPELEPPRLMTVVGVLPAPFELPTGPMDYYTPFVVSASDASPDVTMIGRLRAGAQRTREIGIRMSLGARPTQLVRGLLGQGLRLCLAGTALGLLGAIFLGSFLRSLLFGISATDGVTIVVVIATMTAVVVAATYLPASRASRIDPILALRQE
jgi:hypothetical protein